MKIISKFKDYYDYLQGVYGVDEKVVFDRRFKNEEFYRPDWVLFPGHVLRPFEKYTFAICGTLYEVYYWDGKLYFGEQFEMIPGIEKHKNFYFKAKGYYYTFNGARIDSIYHGEKTVINKDLNIPICLLTPASFSEFNYDGWKIKATNFRLTDFGFSKFIPAKEMYIMLSTFLSKEPETKNKQTDKEKIISHGFDYKKSFRKM